VPGRSVAPGEELIETIDFVFGDAAEDMGRPGLGIAADRNAPPKLPLAGPEHAARRG
jgi:hypothetical protein